MYPAISSPITALTLLYRHWRMTPVGIPTYSILPKLLVKTDLSSVGSGGRMRGYVDLAGQTVITSESPI